MNVVWRDRIMRSA